MDIVKEEAERQRMQREELELELRKVREQILTVPPSGKARRYMEDGMVDLADSLRFVWLAVLLQATYIYVGKRNSYHSPWLSCRHPTDMHNEFLCAQETIKILEKEVSEKESEVITDLLIVYHLFCKVLLVIYAFVATVKCSPGSNFQHFVFSLDCSVQGTYLRAKHSC